MYGDQAMPETGDNVAKEFDVTREQADEFALASQKKYAKAEAEGFYKGEILEVKIPSKKRDAPPTVVAQDEHPRRDATMESLAKLKPLYEGGVVTAGNASGRQRWRRGADHRQPGTGERRTARNPSRESSPPPRAAVEPRIMGVGPGLRHPEGAGASEALAQGHGHHRDQRGLRQPGAGLPALMEVDFKDPRVNPNGGAIAIGHPLGCSGARLALTVSRQLQETGSKYAAVSLCIGVGQGLAVILERVH